MAKHGERRAVRVYHTMVAILILLAGGTLLGLGIWMTVTGSGGPLNLKYSGSNFFNVVLSADIGAIVLGGFLLLTALFSIIALLNQCIGMTFRSLYIFMAIIILTALLFITVVSSLVVHNGDNKNVRAFVSSAWERTVAQDAPTICDIESRYSCRGFKAGDCILCKTGFEPECDPTRLCAKCRAMSAPNTDIGCYDEIKEEFRYIFLPMAIVSGILSAMVLLDIIFTCTL